jgi:hypothetical protein
MPKSRIPLAGFVVPRGSGSGLAGHFEMDPEAQADAGPDKVGIAAANCPSPSWDVSGSRNE